MIIIVWRWGGAAISAVLSFLSVGNTIKIGMDCIVANALVLCDGHSVIDAETKKCLNAPTRSTIVGDHVWLGREVILLKNAHVPRGCIVSARAVVTKEFTEPNCLIAGNPAQVKKKGIDWASEAPLDYIKSHP